MKKGMTLLAMSCALALAACGGDDDRRTTTADTATTDPVNAAPADAVTTDTPGVDPAPVDPMAPMDGTATGDQATPIDPTMDPAATGATSAAATGDRVAEATGDCSVAIEGNDRMQFNVDQINVPASCSEFTITLNHVGQLPEAAMGHNVVVVETTDFAGVAADGLTAGAEAGYVPANDDRVIAATEMIGGGESTSVTFSTASLEEGGDYTFFCSFPGHSALMRGSLNFGG